MNMNLNIKLARKFGGIIAGALVSGFAMEAGQSLCRSLETKVAKLNRQREQTEAS